VLVRPTKYLVATGGLGITGVPAYLAYVGFTEGGPGWGIAYATLSLGAFALTVNFWNYFFVALDDHQIVQSRFFMLWVRRVPCENVSLVSLDTVENFMNATIVRIRIEWPGNLIRLTSSVYPERDLVSLVETLRDNGVPIHPRVQAWLKA